ncbi:MAG TPA: AAA family ATPase, partial [Methanosarcina sp.]|nr:AAA family ATPase [Methanosarcina sp.]
MALSAKPYVQKVEIKHDIQINMSEYPFNIPAVKDIESIRFHPDVTFFVGENGAGKSTILEAIAVALGFGHEGGTKNVQMRTTDSISPLHQALRLVRSFRKPKDGYFLRAESFFNVATYMD